MQDRKRGRGERKLKRFDAQEDHNSVGRLNDNRRSNKEFLGNNHKNENRSNSPVGALTGFKYMPKEQPG